MAKISDLGTGVTSGILTAGASARRFAYIDTRAHYTGEKETEINRVFHDSLIVIGDEERAFIPVLNSYIGPNKATIQDLINKSSNSLVTTLNGMVKDNYITGSQLPLPTTTLTSNPTTLEQKKAALDTLYDENSSGIEVVSYIVYKNGGANVASYSTASDFLTKVAGCIDDPTIFVGSYTGISDNKTIQYAKLATKTAVSYSTHFTQKWTDTQINKLYSEIVGIEYIPVDFDKEDGVTGVGAERFVHLEANNVNYYNQSTYLSYIVTVDSQYLKVADTATTVTAGDKITINDTNKLHYNILFAKVSAGTNIKDINYQSAGDDLTLGTGTAELTIKSDKTVDVTIPANTIAGSGPVVVNVPLSNVIWGKNASAASNLTNITGAITTISKVAEILDKITDGAKDGGVSLAYSIADNRLDIEALSYKVESLISPDKGPDETIYNVNTLQAENKSNFVALTISGNYNKSAEQSNPKGSVFDTDNKVKDSIDWYSASKSGDVKLTLSTKIGTFGASLTDTSTSSHTHATITNYTSYTFSLSVDNGLATTSNVASYVAVAARDILGTASDITYNMIAQLDVTGTGDSTSDTTQIKVIDKVSQTDGLVSSSQRSIKFVDKLTYNGAEGDLSKDPVRTSITKTATETTINVTTSTGSLSHYSANGGTNGHYLATVGDVHSYIMNLVSWVDLSTATKA